MFSSKSPLYSKMEEAYRAEGDVLAVHHVGSANRPGVAKKLSDEHDHDFEHSEKVFDIV